MPDMNATPDVVVAGAGLAGLACALDLSAAGLSVRLLEASGGVGGRMRSDRVDGFVIDRGFQVLNTSYPQVKRRVPLSALRLSPFTAGVLVRTGDGFERFGDPTRRARPSGPPPANRTLGARDLLALAGLFGRDALAPARLVKRGRDGTTRDALAAAGVPDELVERLFRPFLAGVFLEERLETSARFFHLVWRSMLRGTACLPADGIGAVPRALAAGLPEGVLRLECPVERLTGSGVVLADGSEVAARAVVVATGPRVAAALVPEAGIPPYRSVTTYYHRATRTPLAEPTIVTDARLRLFTTCVLSEVARGYAPPGASLIATSVTGTDTAGREARVRETLAEVYEADTAAWEPVAVREIPEALPVMTPPLPLSRTTRVGPGRYVCGDHRATGSVQGALASGTRAAREVLRDLG